MIGAIEFMKRWNDICNANPKTCDMCKLRDICHGSMGLLKEKDIIALISRVMRGGETHASPFYQKDYTTDRSGSEL